MEEDAEVKPGVEATSKQDSRKQSDTNKVNLHPDPEPGDEDKLEDDQDDEQQEDEDEEELNVRIKLEPDEDVSDNTAANPEVRVKMEPANNNDDGNDDNDQDRNADEDRADDEEDDDEDDHVKVTIDDDVPDYNLRAKQRQPQQAKAVAAIDLDAQQPILDIDINTIEDKPWRKPGADISDYFNYGFDEDTWKMYCEKQKRMRSIVNEVSCVTGETTFKIPVMPTNEHSKYSPARMIPTIVSNEPRYNAWIPPAIGSSNEPEHQESNHNPDHRLVGDLDGGGIISIGGHGAGHGGHIGSGGGAAMLRGNVDIRDRDMGRHMRSNDSHSLERIRDRDRKHDRDRERERDIVSERDSRHRVSDRDPSDRLGGLSDRHQVVVDRFDRDIEPRSDLRHRIDRLKEEREHVELDHHSSSAHGQSSSHRSHSGSRSEKHHGISSSSGEKHSSDRIDSSKHGSSSDRQKESHRTEKSGRDRASDKRSDGKSSSSSSRNAERAHRSHRSETTGSKKRDRSKDRSKDRGDREKRRKRAHD